MNVEIESEVLSIRHQQALNLRSGVLRESRNVEIAFQYDALATGWLAQFGEGRGRGRTALLVLIALALHSRPLGLEANEADYRRLLDLDLITAKDRGRLYSRVTDLALAEELNLSRNTIPLALAWLTERRIVTVVTLPQDFEDSQGRFSGNRAYLLAADDFLTLNRPSPTGVNNHVTGPDSSDENAPVPAPATPDIAETTVLKDCARETVPLPNDWARSPTSMPKDQARWERSPSPTVPKDWAYHAQPLSIKKTTTTTTTTIGTPPEFRELTSTRGPSFEPHRQVAVAWYQYTDQALSLADLTEVTLLRERLDLPLPKILAWISLLSAALGHETLGPQLFCALLTGELRPESVGLPHLQLLLPGPHHPSTQKTSTTAANMPALDSASDPVLAQVARWYEGEIGALTPMAADQLRELTTTHRDLERWQRGFEKSISISGPLARWAYVLAVVQGDDHAYSQRKQQRRAAPPAHRDGGSGSAARTGAVTPARRPPRSRRRKSHATSQFTPADVAQLPPPASLTAEEEALITAKIAAERAGQTTSGDQADVHDGSE